MNIMEKIFKKNDGFTFPEIMIALAVTTIITAAILKMFQFQVDEARYLSEKFASLELQKSLTAAMTDQALCTAITSGLTFNSSLIGSTSTPLSISLSSSLPMSSAPGAPPLAVIGQSVSPTAQNLEVANIQLTNFQGNPVGNFFSAEITLSFNSGKLVRPLRPAFSKVGLVTSGVGTKTIARCTGGGAAAFNQNLVFLNNYNTSGLNLPTTCVSLLGSPSALQFYHLHGACSRWCTQSCTATTTAPCNSINTPPAPPLPYAGGSAVGCNGPPNEVVCQCFR